MSLVTMQASAGPVDVSAARSTAQQFAINLGKGPQRAPATGASIVNLVHAEMNPVNPSCAYYYIFNTADSYIIISGDDRAYEILAYGDSPIDMNNIPEGMQYWLDCYRQDMEYLHLRPNLDIATDALPNRAPIWGMTSVEPLLTAMWDQSAPYYNECPTSYGVHCLTGCAATSLSMICYFWNYPTEITNSIPRYTTSTLNMTLEALPPTTFDWDHMLDRYRGNYNSTQADAVAHLMRYVGQAEHMDYTPSASGVGAWDIDRAVKTLGFDSDAKMLFKDNYSDDSWARMIQEELHAGRPLEYCGYGGMSGHAFNVDGYDADRDMYHVNWGWSGSANGYFRLNGFRGGGTTYKNGQLMFIGLQPPATVPTIKVRSSLLNVSALAEKSSTVSFTVKGTMLTSDVTLTLNDTNGTFALSTNRVTVNELASGKNVTVTYSPTHPGTHIATVTLSSDGAEDKIITIYGESVLETHVPVLNSASDVTPSSFSLSWQDRTPTKNVGSYRLERAIAPYNEIRLRESFSSCVSSSADCSSRLDDITATAGWTGNKVYCGDGYIRLGSSNQTGWLRTPALDMRENTGYVTVKLKAKNAGASGESLLRISCGDSDTTVIAPTTETEYCVLMKCEPSDTATIKLSSRVPGQRVFLYDVVVFAGDDFSPVDLSSATYIENIDGTSYTMTNITPNSYALRVQAIYSDGTASQWSNRVRVNVDWAKGDINRDGEVNIADANAVINVILGIIDSRHTVLASDMNGDGEVNVADINALIGIILGQ